MRSMIMAVLITGAAFHPRPARAEPVTQFDGVWKLSFITDNLSECGGPTSYHYVVRIDKGTVSAATGDRVLVSGSVDESGNVKASARKDNGDRANGRGNIRATLDSQRNTWSAVNRPCHGRWSAERVGR